MSEDEGVVGPERCKNADDYGKGVETMSSYSIRGDGGVVIDCKRIKPLFVDAKELRKFLNTDATMFIIEAISREQYYVGNQVTVGHKVLYVSVNANGGPGRNDCAGCTQAQEAADKYGCICTREANGDCVVSDPASGGTTRLVNCPPL
jgi:hypothetical protein